MTRNSAAARVTVARDALGACARANVECLNVARVVWAVDYPCQVIDVQGGNIMAKNLTFPDKNCR